MVSITAWMHLIIPGFVYLSSMYFYFLYFAKVNNTNHLKGIREYLPYITIAIIFISYVLGLSIHLAFEEILSWICPNMKNNPLIQNTKPIEGLIDKIQQVYAGLVMIRHLIISIALLCTSLLVWGNKNSLWRLRYQIITCGVVLELILGLAYLYERSSHLILYNLQ